ncbi:MAG TPA: molybdenum cofactor biosynthesis protein [Candidatus Mediterraneibacter vanvlietii]|nr:molybdenum cofactor biosynthesis protein [Candidatus Mediterraneibacter vanvlietii]
MRAAIFTIDTGAYKAKAESAAASALRRMLEHVGFEVKAAGLLPQEKEVVAAVMRQLSDTGSVEMIITTGAVGYMEEDCAPDALAEVADRLLPGIPEALRAYNLRYSKKSMLERLQAGIRNRTLILNLPESAKTAKEDMEYILPELVQVVENLNI